MCQTFCYEKFIYVPTFHLGLNQKATKHFPPERFMTAEIRDIGREGKIGETM